MSKKRDIPVEDDACPECGGGNTVYDGGTGEVICGACGLVLRESTISLGPEWRDFPGEEETRSRVGAPFSFAVHDNGLTTVIGHVGRNTPLNTRLQMLRLRKWQVRSRVHSYTDRSLTQAMLEIDRLSDKLHIPPTIKEKAAIIYRKALNQGLVRGRSISTIAAAALYAACRMTQTPRTLREITRVSTIDKKDIARCYRLMLRELSIQMPIPDAQLGVPKIAAKVGVGEKTQQKAVEILRRAEKLKTTAGKDPMGLAAAALYIACQMMNEKRTQKMIADAAGVTEVTIRTRYRGLRDILEPEVPSGRPRTRQDGVGTWERRGLEVDQVIGAGAQVEG
jgi:transcription initiation factor TFIIB